MIQDLTVPDSITPTQKRLLEVLANGEHQTVSALCEAAGCSRESYYAALKNQDFVHELFGTATGSIYAAIPKIMDKIVHQAKSGSFAHQKMLLEMVKLYQGDKQETNVQVNNFIVTRGE